MRPRLCLRSAAALLLASALSAPAVAQPRPPASYWEGTIVVEHRMTYDQPDENDISEDGISLTYHLNRTTQSERRVVFRVGASGATAQLSGFEDQFYDQVNFSRGCNADTTWRFSSTTITASSGTLRPASTQASARVTMGADGAFKIDAISPKEHRTYATRNSWRAYDVIIADDYCQRRDSREMGGPFETDAEGMLHAIISGKAAPGATQLVGWSSGSVGNGKPRRGRVPVNEGIMQIYPKIPDQKDPDAPPVETELVTGELMPRYVLRGTDQSGTGSKPISPLLATDGLAPLTQGVEWRVTWNLTRRGPKCSATRDAYEFTKQMRERAINAAESDEREARLLQGEGSAIEAERSRLTERAKSLRESADALTKELQALEQELAKCPS